MSSRPKLPTVTDALGRAYPDGWLYIDDVREIFGLRSIPAVYEACKDGRLPKPDRYASTGCGKRSVWSYSTVCAEMVRRIEAYGVTV